MKRAFIITLALAAGLPGLATAQEAPPPAEAALEAAQAAEPEAAANGERRPLVILDCAVRDDFSLRCRVESETPRGQGYGRAALRIAREFRMAPETDDGESTVGARIRVPVRFDIRP